MTLGIKLLIDNYKSKKTDKERIHELEIAVVYLEEKICILSESINDLRKII